jgi:hypothetical protein
MLSNWEAPYIQSFARAADAQIKSTRIAWAIEYSESVILPIWSKHFPLDVRPRDALLAGRQWLAGAIKLPKAKVSILRCHEAARGCPDVPAAQAAARAIGQSVSTIHSAKHCFGLPLYGALAVAYDVLGPDAPWPELERRAAEECGRMEASLRAYAT